MVFTKDKSDKVEGEPVSSLNKQNFCAPGDKHEEHVPLDVQQSTKDQTEAAVKATKSFRKRKINYI